jgi:hypothetical protein
VGCLVVNDENNQGFSSFFIIVRVSTPYVTAGTYKMKRRAN